MLCMLPLMAAEGTQTQPQQNHPFFRTDAQPQWSQMTPQQLLADVDAACEQAKARFAALAAVTPENATFRNTFLAYYEAEENLQQAQTYLYHLLHTVGGEQWLKAQEAVITKTAEYESARPHAERVWQVLQAAASAPWVSSLSEAEQYFIARTMTRLRASGAGLPPDKQTRKSAIDSEIKQLSMQYVANLANANGVWQLVITEPEQLADMPEDWMNTARQAALEAGFGSEDKPAWLINLSNSPAWPVLTHCTVEETRKQCWYGANSIGTAYALDNEPIILRILELRQELAELLGYASFADMQAAQLMMGSGENALAFVDELLEKSRPAYEAWVATELERLSMGAGRKLTSVNPWDEAFFSAKNPAAGGGFDAGKITPYLQAEKVLRGMFDIWEHMYSLRIAEVPAVCLKPGEQCPQGAREVWHPAVRVFAVYDAADGTHLGDCCLDLYPRPGKRDMGWCMPLRFGGKGEAHLAAIVANLTPPPGPGKPHLYSHGDLYVLFHEFGHMMHMLLGHSALRGQSAMDAERDFVEMPSQLQENWIWQPEALATFAFHHETGEPLPKELAEQLAASRFAGPITFHMRMLCAAKLDLEMHHHYREKFHGRSLDAASAQLLAPWQFPYSVPTPCEMRNFIYCMTEGYSASFYTYKWSEVLAADAFSRFEREGILNAATGAAYRKAILNPAASRPMSDSFRAFMGRNPSPAALLKQYGL